MQIAFLDKVLWTTLVYSHLDILNILRNIFRFFNRPDVACSIFICMWTIHTLRHLQFVETSWCGLKYGDEFVEYAEKEQSIQKIQLDWFIQVGPWILQSNAKT